MLHHPRLFSLSQVLTLPRTNSVSLDNEPSSSEDESIVDYVAHHNGQGLIIITSRGHILSAQLPDEDHDIRFHRLPWFQNEDLLPRCVTLSPDDQYALICSHKLQLFMVPSILILPDAKTGTEVDGNSMPWPNSSITHICDVEESAIPSSLCWWSTHESNTLVLIGTLNGQLICFDLIKKLMVSSRILKSLTAYLCTLTVLELNRFSSVLLGLSQINKVEIDLTLV